MARILGTAVTPGPEVCHDSVTPPDTGRGTDTDRKLKWSQMVIDQTAVTNLMDINLTGRVIKVTEMATKVTEEDIGVTERELNREGTDTTVPAGNLQSMRWTGWLAEDISPMGITDT